MPLYEYRCDKCGTIFEKRLSMSDNKLPESEPCPSCSELGNVLQYLGAPPPIHSGHGIASSGKINGGFREVLQKVKENNHGSTIDV